LPYTWDVDLYGPYIVVATSGGIYTLLMAGGSPLYKGLTDLHQYVGELSGYHVLDVAVWGDVAYVAAGSDGLLVVDVSDPANPVVLSQYSHATIVDYRAVAVQWPHCYIADRAPSDPSSSPGFIAINVEDPYNPFFMDRRALSYACDVYVEGDLAYIADGTSGLYIYNVSDPYNIPFYISTVSDGYNYTAVVAQGHFFYATAVDPSAGKRGIYMYDVTDLSSPVLTDTFTFSYPYGLAVDGDFCALADGYYGTYLLNTTDPFSIHFIGFLNPPGSNDTQDAAIFGPYILATERQGGLYLINASDPRNLEELFRYNFTSMDALSVYLYGDFAYLANRDSLLIFRFYQSPGDTYNVGTFTAQSLQVDSTDFLIVNATLTANAWTPPGASISWEMSADGGLHWESVTPGVLHVFTYPGNDLRWRATLGTVNDYTSPHLYNLTISYSWIEVTPSPPPPIPGFPIEAILLGAALSMALVLAIRHRRKRM